MKNSRESERTLSFMKTLSNTSKSKIELPVKEDLLDWIKYFKQFRRMKRNQPTLKSLNMMKLREAKLPNAR